MLVKTRTVEEDLAQLDEIVVIGYGTQKKKEITGAVKIRTGKKLNARIAVKDGTCEWWLEQIM